MLEQNLPNTTIDSRAKILEDAVERIVGKLLVGMGGFCLLVIGIIFNLWHKPTPTDFGDVWRSLLNIEIRFNE